MAAPPIRVSWCHKRDLSGGASTTVASSCAVAQEKQYRISFIVYGMGDGFAETGFAACVCWQPADRTEAINRATRIRKATCPPRQLINASNEGFRRRKRFPADPPLSRKTARMRRSPVKDRL